MTATNGGDKGKRVKLKNSWRCQEMMDENSKPEVEDADDSDEDEEPHLTWVEKYDRPMPQVAA